MRKMLKFKFIIAAIVLYATAFVYDSEIFFTALNYTKDFLLEMLQILPPVLIITAMITVWVPSELIKKALGTASGIRGKLLSLAIGSISAGPVYAAFPATLMLFRKGASVSNIVIILSSWAVIKVPMLLVEMKFLSLKFMTVRLLLTIPAILLTGLVTEKFVPRTDIRNAGPEIDKKLILPEMNCGGCGFGSCADFGKAVENNLQTIDNCVFLKKAEQGERT